MKEIPFLPRTSPGLLAHIQQPSPGWRFPIYAGTLFDGNHATLRAAGSTLDAPGWYQRTLRRWISAAFIEWRYFSVITPAFHGIVGMALFNPAELFKQLAEGGLLVILAGMLDLPEQLAAQSHTMRDLPQICWMHLFPTDQLTFEGIDAATVRAEGQGVQLVCEHLAPQQHRLLLRHERGLEVRLEHYGLDGTAIAPTYAEDVGYLPGTHWVVYNPSPIARTSGAITMTPEFLAQIIGQSFPTIASPALARLVARDTCCARWDHGNGYYEHSFGLNPLPLHGWDFLFVPDAQRQQGIVLQTYQRSQTLRYLEVLWHDGAEQRYTRFSADQLHLVWEDTYLDPHIHVRLPRKRVIVAHKPGLQLELENTILHQIPFLRPATPAVRHFFISEQIGVTNWRLMDDADKLLVEVRDQPSGGEIAHGRLWPPRA